MTIKKAVSLFLGAGLMLALAGCGSEQERNKYVEPVLGEAVEYTGSDWITVGEGDTMLLMLDPSTCTLRWENKETGEYLDTRTFDENVSNVALKSDIVAYYFNGTESEPYRSYTYMDNYTYSVEVDDAITYEAMDNGVRVRYNIGSDSISYQDFPATISSERMQDLVLQYCDATQLQAVENAFRETQSGIWARVSNADYPLRGLALNQLYEIFYEVGQYTYEELEVDAEVGGFTDALPSRQEILMSMEYYLDGDDLMVRIPTDEISSGEDYPLRSLSVLPYFMSTTSDDGYMLVPDGSGALIYLDNTRVNESQFSSRYWGGDVLIDAGTYSTMAANMTMPIYGMKVGDMAVLGIIEEGAEVATLSTYIRNSYNGIPYNRMSLSFAIREDQTLSTYNSAFYDFTNKKASTDYYASDILLRYCFMTDEDASYTGMATAYRERLLAQGALKQNETEEEAPLFVELLGGVEATEYLMGFPYTGIRTLTDFTQAQEILSDLKGKGVSNMMVAYNGIIQGGLDQQAAKSVNVLSELGGRSGLTRLLSYAQGEGIKIFPQLQLQTYYTDKGISEAQSSFFLNGERAQLYRFDPVMRQPVTNDEYPHYIVSPDYLTTYLDRLSTSYSRLGSSNLASEDFFAFIGGSYARGNNISMTTALPAYEGALDSLSESYTLMLSNPISLAYRATDYLTDLPTSSTRQKITDVDVPFVQLVLSGYQTYSTENLNSTSYDVEEEFMKAVETGSALKFRLMYADEALLEDTTANDIFVAGYENWKDLIPEYYARYQEVYDQCKGASIQSHDLYDTAGELICVTWTNGTRVYLNYSDENAMIAGVSVPAGSYIVNGGGANE